MPCIRPCFSDFALLPRHYCTRQFLPSIIELIPDDQLSLSSGCHPQGCMFVHTRSTLNCLSHTLLAREYHCAETESAQNLIACTAGRTPGLAQPSRSRMNENGVYMPQAAFPLILY